MSIIFDKLIDLDGISKSIKINQIEYGHYTSSNPLTLSAQAIHSGTQAPITIPGYSCVASLYSRAFGSSAGYCNYSRRSDGVTSIFNPRTSGTATPYSIMFIDIYVKDD